ncbi:phosphoribosylanthranilate isomerase [Legionella israelensis]|uniref:phosphoribosylanthranilate isomerase n=1 Tax=Legionella israelensis TaxID=454 RepID=UPI00117DD5EC|nr:phosphoribosylanthranilate isomerase [Legionella israelensis]QDP72552.1 phosphoribosylanthranilate isomerase [Legionella israelensis]
MSRIRIKFCGMTRKEDIILATSLGVDAIGLIFASESSRCVTLQKAKYLLSDIPPFIDAVAVLVNPKPDRVKQILQEIPVQLLQFHGNESPEFCEQFNFPYIKVVAANTSEIITESAQSYRSSSAILLDTPSTKIHGGTGRTFDWQMIPEILPKPYILAGGLNEANIKRALQYNPYAVDVCSGVELSPGIKDHDKMKRFVKLMRVNNDQ